MLVVAVVAYLALVIVMYGAVSKDAGCITERVVASYIAAWWPAFWAILAVLVVARFFSVIGARHVAPIMEKIYAYLGA